MDKVKVFLSPSYTQKTFRDDVTKVRFINKEGKVTVHAFNVDVDDLRGVNSALLNETLLPYDTKSYKYLEDLQIASIVRVSSIQLNKTTTSLIVGGSEVLVATVLPTNAENKTVTFTSNNTTVATVDNAGKVMAIAGGAATITATADGKTATCIVNVTVPVTGVTMSKASTTLAVGATEKVTATVAPANATNKAVSFVSDKAAVATVDNAGNIKAVSGGTATITANASGKTATCVVTVTVPVASVSFNKTATTLTVGATEKLTATIAPANATNKTMTIVSDKPAVATVDNAGNVKAIAEGSAKITVTASGKTATCMVTVNPVPPVEPEPEPETPAA